MRDLTTRQRAFVREYLVDSCGAKAVVRAGYSAKSASVQAAHLLKIPAVAKAIKVGRNLANDRCEVKADWIVAELHRIASADHSELTALHIVACPQCWEHQEPQDTANPKCPRCHGGGVHDVVLADTRYLTPEARALFAGVRRTRDGIEVKTHDKMKALEILARIKGLDKPEPPAPVGIEGGTLILRFGPAVPPTATP